MSSSSGIVCGFEEKEKDDADWESWRVHGGTEPSSIVRCWRERSEEKWKPEANRYYAVNGELEVPLLRPSMQCHKLVMSQRSQSCDGYPRSKFPPDFKMEKLGRIYCRPLRSNCSSIVGGITGADEA